jgi:hypothetical protein
MTVMNAPVLDLLRQRRESLGVDSLAEALADRPSLLRRGALIAAGLVGTVLAALALVFVSHQVVKARMGELVQYEGQANALRTELQARRTRGGGAAWPPTAAWPWRSPACEPHRRCCPNCSCEPPKAFSCSVPPPVRPTW